jgi:signal peptidase II
MSSPHQKLIGYTLIIALVILIDQGLKYVVPSFYPVSKNTGVIFGLFAQSGFYLTTIGLGVLGLIIVKNKLSSASAFLLGGAVSNLIDRLRFGYVVDYIDIDLIAGLEMNLPVFNLADVAIVIGISLLLIDITHSGSPKSRLIKTR